MSNVISAQEFLARKLIIACAELTDLRAHHRMSLAVAECLVHRLPVTILWDSKGISVGRPITLHYPQ